MTNILVGKTITAIYLAEDGKAMKFYLLGHDPVIAKFEGDCCSRTWVENVENPAAAVGSPVLVADDLDMPESLRGEDDYDVTRCYGFKIETVKGTCVIDFRNESNGYYGGRIVWPEDYFYGGTFDQNVSKEEWKRIDAEDDGEDDGSFED